MSGFGDGLYCSLCALGEGDECEFFAGKGWTGSDDSIVSRLA